MAQYTKHNSNYIKTVEHKHLKDGSTIFERDWVTIGSQLNFGPGKIPYYNDGNFIFTTSPTPFFQKRYKNGVTVATWTYDDVKEASSTVNQIQFDEYTQDIRSFAYYGSCVELLRATIEKIIYEFPGNIKVSDEDLGVYKSVEEFECEGENKEEKYVPLHDVGENDDVQTLWTLKNPFDINIFLQNVQLTKYDNPLRYLTYSWKDYLVSTGGDFNEITSYEVVMRQMYEKEAEPCDETIKKYITSANFGGSGQLQSISLEKGNYFIEVNDQQKLTNWTNLCHNNSDSICFNISQNAISIKTDEEGNVKLVLSDDTEQQINGVSAAEESVKIDFYKEVKIPRTYKYYQMFSEEEYKETYFEQGWVKSNCVMRFWLPDTVFLNRCDKFQKNILYSEESNLGKNQAVYTVKINNNILIEGYIYDGEVIPLVRDNYKDNNLVIQPKEEIIEAYFNGLKGFEKQLLTRKTKPLYTNKFITPIEYNLGYLYYKRTYTWPSDGYCIDITSTKYIDFINKLSNMAELYDELWTDNLWRRMTHEAIKNYDWTYTREFIDGDEEDNVDGGERMHKVLNVIGRVFDDIKLSIDTIKRQNKTTYNGDRNVPNALLSDKLELFGWDIYSTIPTYKNEDGETVSASEETITQEVFSTFINNWYPTSNPNKITFADVDVEFMRRLLLSTRRVFETKGTRQSIDMIMGLFGYGNSDEQNPDYIITEHYRTVTPREYDKVIDQQTNETLGDRIVRLNNQEKQMELLYDEDASGIPVASFIGGYDEQGNPKTYLIPYYDQTKIYDGNLYFQNKGGWFYRKDNNSTEIDFSKWTETLSYLHVVSQVKDLMNVNPFEIKNGDIYYVANLNDYIDYTETTDTLYSHFFAMTNELMPEEFSSWVNINLEDGFYDVNTNYSNEEATLYDIYAKKAKYLETIIPYNIGNNPHVGYGEYDMGNEFFEYMKKPFKYALDKNYFASPYYEEANQIEFEVSDGIGAQYNIENDEKIVIVNDEDDGEEDNEDNVKEQYYLNDKLIIFKNKIENDEYKKYFKTVIINYLMQIIPSTAIFVLENFALNGDKDEDDSDKFLVTFIFNDGRERTVKIKSGTNVNCPSNTKWKLKGGDNTIYEQEDGFPYEVKEDTTFIEYVIVYYTVRFYETEGGEPTRTESIESGKTINASGQWYRLGDANKAQVTFPYEVNNNVDFVRLVKFTVKWYDNADDTEPTTQQVTRGNNITELESGQRYYRKNDSTYTIVLFPITAQQNEEFVKVTTYTVKWYQSEDDTKPEEQNDVIYGQSVTKPGQWCLMSNPQKIVSLPYRITQNTEFVKYTAPITYYIVRYFENESTTQTLYEQSVAEGQKTTNPDPNISWYVRGDSNKTPIVFSNYVVNSNVDFIKIPQYTVIWVDNNETI